MPRTKRLLALLVPVIAAGIRLWGRSEKPPATRAPAVPDSTAKATERYLLFCMIPLWVITGSLDYIWHRKTSIQTTSGLQESVIHALMMTEAGLPMVLGLYLEVNAGVILLMLAGFFAHAATAIWDVSFAVGRRKVTPTEQHIHSFLEVLPFCAVSFIICLHSDQFLALLGAGEEAPRFELRRKSPPLSNRYLAGLFGGIAVNGAAYGEELLRCYRAKLQGLEGTETPPAARELYGT